jgi:TonB family protein
MNRRATVVSFLVFCAIGSASYAQDSMAAFTPHGDGTAIDAKGVRHRYGVRGRQVTLAPWIRDNLQAVAPVYPRRERAAYNQGTGMFRLQLDLSTGHVRKVVIVKSTGFPLLDKCAVMALRQWRWKPGRWREIELPVRFVIQERPFRLPPGAVRLPQNS